jgi:tetratricopeptide (TPR) repeat protein
LALDRLAPAAVGQLAAATGVNMPEAVGQRLYRETEGLPFFVVEYLRALRESGVDAARDDFATPDDAAWDLPPTVRDLLRARLAAAGETGRQLLQAAAIIDRAVPFERLKTASGRTEEEVVTALEELLARGLLVEQRAAGAAVLGGGPAAGPVYDFSHHKLRELVFEETGPLRRRLLHRRIAETLAAAARRLPQPAALAGQIATHYQDAGQPAEAAAYFRQAGDHARALFAHREALAHYETALALGHPDPAALQEASADVHTRLGNYRAALSNYEAAAAQADEDVLGRLEHKLAQVYRRLGEWALAERQLARAQASYGSAADPAALVGLAIDGSYVAHRQDQPAEARRAAEEAFALAEAAGDVPSMAQAHNILGILAHHAGEVEAATQHLVHSSQLAASVGQLEIQVAALNNLARAENAAGRRAQALEHLATALDYCTTTGDRHHQAALHNNLADLLHQDGQEEAAVAQLKQAVTIFAEIGRAAGEWQPEIWKLSEW